MKKAALAALLAFVISAACGGGGSSPPPNNPPPGGNQNVCATADTAEADPAAPPPRPSNPEKRSGRADGSNRWRVLDALYAHRQARDRGFRGAEGVAPRNNEDIGQIAVVQDDGELLIPANPYDLRDLGLRFTRNSAGGYDVRRIDGAFRTALGQRLTLSDDDTRRLDVGFGFPFYGSNRTAAFVNSDGNVTFGEGDSASLDRSVARMLTGPPRVSLFFADLDPSTGGSVFANAAADQYTVTWCGVRGFDDTRTTTAQLTLLPTGDIEFKYAASIALPDAVVGVSPGRTGDFTPVDLSAQGPTPGGAGAVGERFASQSELDILEVALKFYRDHPDSYDQLVIWTDAPAIRDAFAFETTVKNEIRGIGLDVFDFAGEFGSAGTLRSLVIMDWLGKYSDSANEKILGENTTFSVLGQEAGHRWLAFLNFRFPNDTAPSDALLGRDGSHWSFFFDSDASVMEGNDINDKGGGSFETVAAVQRYSRLDQYAMGLVSESDVPTFFYVDSPMNISRPNTDRESAPRVGVTFNGTRRDVSIADVVRVHGPRNPAAGSGSRNHRQAFLYIVGRGRQPGSGDVSKLDRIRTTWETFFRQATENRMSAVTVLR